MTLTSRPDLMLDLQPIKLQMTNRRKIVLPLNPFMPNGLFYLNTLDKSFSNRRGVWLVLLLPCVLEIPVLNANSADPDQMSHSAASDLGLHCLLMSLL